MLNICISIASIGDNHIAIFAKARDDKIVKNAAFFIKEESIFRLPYPKRCGIKRTGLLQKFRRFRAGHFDQLHMGDVKKTDMSAGVKVLLHHAERISDRHVPASKAAKARASFFMQVMQRQSIQKCGIAHNNSRVARMPPRNAVASCPSVSGLRDSHGYIESHTYTFGAEFPPTFQSCLTRLRFMVPERFRAISPSVANLRQLSPADKQ